MTRRGGHRGLVDPTSPTTPSRMKKAAEARFIQTAGTTLPTASPAITAIADVVTSARAAPKKTLHLDPDVAKEKVATWVLSPISARKTAANVDMRSFQSMAAEDTFHRG
jgi:hypothetical protein